MAATRKNRLKISQLARRAGVTVPTVKHYVREGLLPRPVKTSRNMAYYSEESIDRIRLVKKIQKERYLPLAVIKRLLDAGESFDEELALGRAILKTNRIGSTETPLKRAGIEAATGCPLDKIDTIEERGLIHPLTEGGEKAYLPEDVALIRVVKARDDLGVPFEASLSTLRIYGDALTGAVQEDINFFVRNITARTPTRRAIRFITEADETLDRFIVFFRQKMLRQFGEKTIEALNRLPENLAVLNFLPVTGITLPDHPPATPPYNRIYNLLKGATLLPAGAVRPQDLVAEPQRMKALAILSLLVTGDTQNALKLVQALIPEPAETALENAAAALTYLFAMDTSSGFALPMLNVNKVFHHLARIEKLEPETTPDRFFSRYVCGSVYLFLPGVFNTRRTGIDLLGALKKELDGIDFKKFDWPVWLIRTLEKEIAPRLRVRINRFLASAYLTCGNRKSAGACLDAVLQGTGPQSEHAAWARTEKRKF